MMAIRAVVKDGLIKPLEAIGLPEDKEIVIYISEEKEERFFFPSAFDFWNEAREDLYQQHIVINDLCDERKKFPFENFLTIKVPFTHIPPSPAYNSRATTSKHLQ